MSKLTKYDIDVMLEKIRDYYTSRGQPFISVQVDSEINFTGNGLEVIGLLEVAKLRVYEDYNETT